MIGAVGGSEQKVDFVWSVARRTNKENVRQFLDKLFEEITYLPSQVVIVMDNHSSHHSTAITDFLKAQQAEVLFMAPYSSRLNNVEFVWALLKKLWANFISRITVEYDKKKLTSDVELIAELTGRRLTPAILKATDHLYEKCLLGELL